MRQLPTNDLIREVLGPNHPVPLGWVVLVQTYIDGPNFKSADGSDSEFLRSDIAIEREQYHSCVGRVLMIGSACYKGEKFKHWGELIPHVGDFVDVKKYGGVLKKWTNPETKKIIHIQEVEDILVRCIVPETNQSFSHNFLGK